MNYLKQSVIRRVIKGLMADPIRRSYSRLIHWSSIPLAWCEGSNWGDALSPVLVKLLSGKTVVHLDGLHHDRYLVIGSILGNANERSEVWGSGFIQEKARVLGKPRAVHAVRGPLSRTTLLEQGISCPEVYGDPALLLPRFFNPDVPKNYPVGIVPHYIDKKNPWLKSHNLNPEVLILDIESGIENFVKAVKSCEVIISSSLHGLICADAYGIPNLWVTLSDQVIGGDFKFRDYRLSIGADDPSPIRITSGTTLHELVKKAEVHPINIDLRKLILSCPFLSDDLRREVIDAGKSLPANFVSRRLINEKLGMY